MLSIQTKSVNGIHTNLTKKNRTIVSSQHWYPKKYFETRLQATVLYSHICTFKLEYKPELKEDSTKK